MDWEFEMKLVQAVIMRPLQDIWHSIGVLETVIVRDYCDLNIWNYLEERMGLEYSEHTDGIRPWGENEIGEIEGWGLYDEDHSDVDVH